MKFFKCLSIGIVPYLICLTMSEVRAVRETCALPELVHPNVVGRVTMLTTLRMGPIKRTLEACPSSNDRTRRYRRVDGRCNHDRDYGRTNKPVKRYIPAHYQDSAGIEAPRLHSVGGSPLPSPRLISRRIHTDREVPDHHTLMLMQFGQFIDHDITSAPVPTEKNHTIKCCGVPRQLKHKSCLPILVPRNDRRFSSDCMEFVRSNAAMNPDGSVIYPREQLNALTSFLDGSAIYGNEEKTLAKLRTHKGNGALLRTRQVDGKERLPRNGKGECVISSHTHGSYCQLAGDDRVNEQPYLGSMHTMFHLFHNNMVRKLAKIKLQNKGRNASTTVRVERYIKYVHRYEKEILFQEARKIVGAVLQKIAYCDWLPIVLGPKLIKKFELGCEKRSHYHGNVDPRIANVFLTAAFRFGHSLIPRKMKINETFIDLKDLFMLPEHSVRNYDVNLGCMLEPGLQLRFDRFVTPAVTNHLFESETGRDNALDLVSLNIQRGRDHGIPSYYYWQRHYDIKRSISFSDFGNMENKLSRLYMDVLDIDLFTGGLLEKPLPGAVVGPTFGHIIANQFADLKFGDKYFFMTSRVREGFTDDQLASIKSISMNNVLCECTDLKMIQNNAFLPVSDSNPSIPCKDIPALDLTPWLSKKRAARNVVVGESNTES